MAIELKPEEQQLVKRAEELSGEMETYKVSDQIQFDNAGMFLLDIKENYKKIEAVRFSMTRPLDESKANIMAFFKIPLEKLAKAESILKGARVKYQQIQEDKRRQEEARLADIQRKEAEKLAAKAAKEAEKGNHAKAEELIQQAQEKESIVPVAPITVTKTKGIKLLTNWKFRITNDTLLPREYLIADEKKIGAVVRATKGTLNIPGVEIYKEQTEAV